MGRVNVNEFKEAVRMLGFRARWNDGGDPPAGDPPAGDPPAGDPPAFIDTIPEEHRDKPWAKDNATSAENFFKYVDNQVTLIGKKGIILPAEGAPAEVVNEYYKGIGRPDSAEGYEFSLVDGVERNAEMDGKVKQILFDAGIPKDMAAKVVAGYEGMVMEQNKEAIATQDAEDVAFAKFNTDLFGDNKEGIVTNAQKVLRETLPKEAHPALDRMTADQMSLVVAVTDSVFKKYAGEDKFRGGEPGGTPAGADSYETLSAQQRELMGKEGFKNWQHPDHNSLMAQNSVLMTKMRSLKK